MKLHETAVLRARRIIVRQRFTRYTVGQSAVTLIVGHRFTSIIALWLCLLFLHGIVIAEILNPLKVFIANGFACYVGTAEATGIEFFQWNLRVRSTAFANRVFQVL